VIGRLWRATYFKQRASLFDEKLFQRFLNGQVIERKGADWNVSLYVRVCGSLPIRKNGWDQRMRLVRLLSQHGRLTQPWGKNVYKWIKTEIITWVRTEPYEEIEVACNARRSA
jgi:hypothetical protein